MKKFVPETTIESRDVMQKLDKVLTLRDDDFLVIQIEESLGEDNLLTSEYYNFIWVLEYLYEPVKEGERSPQDKWSLNRAIVLPKIAYGIFKIEHDKEKDLKKSEDFYLNIALKLDKLYPDEILFMTHNKNHFNQYIEKSQSSRLPYYIQ